MTFLSMFSSEMSSVCVWFSLVADGEDNSYIYVAANSATNHSANLSLEELCSHHTGTTINLLSLDTGFNPVDHDTDLTLSLKHPLSLTPLSPSVLESPPLSSISHSLPLLLYPYCYLSFCCGLFQFVAYKYA